MIKSILIVEDEPFAMQDLRESLLRISPSLEISSAITGGQALDLLRSRPYDALFLDIELPGIDGLEVMRELGSAAPPTVLVTGHPQEAVEAFGMNVVECILKPVDEAKLQEVMRKIAGGRLQAGAPQLATAGVASPAGPRRILLHDGRRTWLVRLADVMRFQQEGAAVRGFHPEGSGIVETSLSALLALDPSAGFFQVNHFTIVNPASVHSINRGLDDSLAVRCSDGVEIPFERDFEAPFFARYAL